MPFKADLDGRHEEALIHFRRVVDRGARTYVEYGLARRVIATTIASTSRRSRRQWSRCMWLPPQNSG